MTKQRLNNLRYLVFMTLSILFSCNKVTEKFELKSKDGLLIISGSKRDGEPDGKWEYFDDNGRLIKEMLYNNKVLEVVRFYSNGNVIYFESYHNNEIERRVAFGISNQFEGGSYIVQSKCTSCHRISNNGIARSIKKIVTDKKLFDSYSFLEAFNQNMGKLDSMHHKIYLSQFEIEDIIRYVKFSPELSLE